MPARTPCLILVRQALFGFWAALLLATVGLQATAPVAAPLEPAHGSAFSATTFEVALAAQRRADPARQAPAPQPLLPVSPEPRPLTPAATLIPAPAPRPASTGPPAREILAFLPAPRAPPRA